LEVDNAWRHATLSTHRLSPSSLFESCLLIFIHTLFLVWMFFSSYLNALIWLHSTNWSRLILLPDYFYLVALS